MYKKLAISLFCLCIVLLSVSAVAQDDTEAIDEVVIDDASLEEVTTDSPTADIGLDQPADRDVTSDEELIEPTTAEPIEMTPLDSEPATIDQTQTQQPVSTYDDSGSYSTTSQSSGGRIYSTGTRTYANPQVRFNLRSRDNTGVRTIFYEIDNQGEQTFSSPFSISQPGDHTITYYADDTNNNRENPRVYNVTIDDQAPVIRVNTETPVQYINGRYYISQSAHVTIDASDDSSGVRNVMYTLNGTDYRNYTTAFTFNALGDINFHVRAEDNVGNMIETYSMMLPDASGNMVMVENRNLTFYVDNEAPTVSIAADRQFVGRRNNVQIAGSDFMYSITAQDTDSGVAQILYRTNGQGAFRVYEQPFRLPNNGDHFIEARAVDTVGNVSETAVLQVYVDDTPPNTTITTITEDGESQPQR